MAITPRTTKVDILQGDDNERLADLYHDVQVAEQRAREAVDRGVPRRSGDEAPTDEVTKAKAAMRAFAEEAADRAVTVRLRDIGRGRFRDLRREHEPRKVKRVVDGEEIEVTHEDDQRFINAAQSMMDVTVHGVNTETFPEALLRYVDKDDPEVRTILEPSFNTEKERNRFLDDELSEGAFERLWTAAFFLNAQGGNDPKAGIAFATSQTSGETSE